MTTFHEFVQTLARDRATNIAPIFWYPALVCMAGFELLFLALVLLRTQTEIRARRMRALLARAQRA